MEGTVVSGETRADGVVWVGKKANRRDAGWTRETGGIGQVRARRPRHSLYGFGKGIPAISLNP